ALSGLGFSTQRVDGRPPWRRWLPWGLGAVAITMAIALARGSDDEPPPPSEAPAPVELPAWLGGKGDAKLDDASHAAVAGAKLPVPVPVLPVMRRADADDLAELDAKLARAELTAALTRADELLVDAPDDPALHLRRARALMRTGGRDGEAISAFGEALAH